MKYIKNILISKKKQSTLFYYKNKFKQIFLEKRKKIIEEIKNLRNEIISKGEDILYIKSKSSSKIIRISRQESKIIKDDEKNIKKEKNKNKSKPKSALNKERKSFVENQIEQEKHVIQNIKNQKEKEVLNMFAFYLKKKNIIEDIENRKKEQEEKAIKKEKENFEKRKKEQEKKKQKNNKDKF